jgi:Flp pilus assembly protein TadD
MPIYRDTVQDAQTIARVEAAARANDLSRAVELARAALSDGLVHPLLLNVRSHWFLERGRPDAALADLRRAFQLAPTDVFVRNALGLLLVQLDHRDEAIPLMRETAELFPDSAIAQYSLGSALERAGELDEARTHHERAVALDPSFAKPLAHLADFAQRRSDYAAAKRYANAALALEPQHYVAHTILAIVALSEGRVAEAEALITPQLARPAETPIDAAVARRVLGDVRHAQGRYAQAFASYTESNRQKYEIHKRQFETPGSTAADYAQWLLDYFKEADPAQWSAKRADAPTDDHNGARTHAFLVGFPRSGTTLLENVLKSHPDVETLEEKDTFGDLTSLFLVNDDGRDMLAGMPGAMLPSQRVSYWDRVARFGADVCGKVFIDKYPLSSLKLPLVAKLMPGAKVLFAVRDPRDVVLSCYRRNFAMNTSMFEFLDIARTARFYATVQALCAVYRERLGLDWLPLRNEDLVADFEGEARRICDFLGLEWNAAMADFAEHAKGRTIRTPSSVQVVRGINSEGVGVWRHYAEQMAPAMAILKPWIEAYGYPAE